MIKLHIIILFIIWNQLKIYLNYSIKKSNKEQDKNIKKQIKKYNITQFKFKSNNGEYYQYIPFGDTYQEIWYEKPRNYGSIRVDKQAQTGVKEAVLLKPKYLD